MQNFTCPFCSLLCDDIRLEIKNNSFVPLNSNCLILKKSLKRKIKDHFPRIKGKKTTMSIAIEELAKLIKKSKSILFAGMGTDTKGTKASLDILDKFGGTIDHFSGDSYSKNLKSIQQKTDKFRGFPGYYYCRNFRKYRTPVDLYRNKKMSISFETNLKNVKEELS